MARRHLKPLSSYFLSPARRLLLLTLVLSIIGLFFVFEASVGEALQLLGDPYHFVRQQILHFLLGFVALGMGYLIPVAWWQKISPFAYAGGVILLLLVITPGLRTEINGAYRWLYLGGFGLQPIEAVKFAVCIFFASWMSRHQRLLPFLFLTGIPMGLVMLQPDLGSTIILLSIAFTLYFVAGGEWKAFSLISGAGIILLALLIVISPYRRERIQTFLNPESDPLGASFHIRQITLALGNGGMLGQGIGKSQQKFSYIPEASTDSIFAIVAEEVGFIGSVVIIGLFGLFIWTGYEIVTKTTQGMYAQLVGMGIVTWITAQISLNLAAVVALVPLTGVPLPFFSYGGSSLVMILFATGVLLSVSKPP